MSKCVVCNVGIGIDEEIVTSDENENSLLEKFLNHFDVDCSSSFEKYNYFCNDCSFIVIKLIDLRERFFLIQNELLKTESIVTTKILTQFYNSSDSPHEEKEQKNENENHEDLDLDLIKEKKRRVQDVLKIRKNICKRFLPKVRLSEVSSKSETIKIRSKSKSPQPQKRKAVENSNSKEQTSKKSKNVQDDESSDLLQSDSNDSDEDKDVNSNHHDDVINISDENDDNSDEDEDKSEDNDENDEEKNVAKSQGVVINGVVRWPCDKCQSTFGRRRDMVKHRKNKHQNPSPEKQHWKSVLVAPGKFEYGLKKWPYENDEEKSTFKCMTCSVMKKTRDEITQHIDRVHDKSVKPTCLKCFKSFVSENRLKIHSCRPREKSREFKTRSQEDGSWIYNGKWQFTKEPDRTDGGHQFLCRSCGVFRKTMEMMKSHCREQHEHANSVLCTECGLTFNAQRFLTRHIEAVHSEGQGQYLCVDCGRQCKTLSGLYNHRRDRHQEIVYPCSCEQTFKYGSALSKHRRETGHPPAPKNPATCPRCETTFRSERGFRAHEKKCTGLKKGKIKDLTEYECEECANAGLPVRLPSLNSYKKHLAQHISEKQNDQNECGDSVPSSSSTPNPIPVTITIDDDESENEHEARGQEQQLNSENNNNNLISSPSSGFFS